MRDVIRSVVIVNGSESEITRFGEYVRDKESRFAISKFTDVEDRLSSYDAKEHRFDFETFDQPPIVAIEKIAHEFPELEIEYQWASSIIGHNCGSILYCIDKRVVVNVMKEDSQEAYHTFIKCWGDDCCFKTDKEGKLIEKECVGDCMFCITR